MRCPLQLAIVSDNGPAFKSADFVAFFARHPELRHVRTRHHAPETNGVVERFNRSLKYEHLYREEIRDVIELRDEEREDKARRSAETLERANFWELTSSCVETSPRSRPG